MFSAGGCGGDRVHLGYEDTGEGVCRCVTRKHIGSVGLSLRGNQRKVGVHGKENADRHHSGCKWGEDAGKSDECGAWHRLGLGLVLVFRGGINGT